MMRTFTAMLLMTAVLTACSSGTDMKWTDLTPRDPGAGPLFEMAGTVHHLDLEGGLYVIRDAQGTQYQPLNLPAEFQVDGLAIEVLARQRDDVMTTGMAGAVIELTRIRKAPPDANRAPDDAS